MLRSIRLEVDDDHLRRVHLDSFQNQIPIQFEDTIAAHKIAIGKSTEANSVTIMVNGVSAVKVLLPKIAIKLPKWSL